MKEKVSRPDKTGAWDRENSTPLADWILSYETPYEEIKPFKGNAKPAGTRIAERIANQAIEKMIASASEKE